MQTTYSFRIYPSKEQEGLMNQTIELCRQLYNAALEQRQIGWKFKNIQSQVLQDVLRRLDTAFQNFFEGRAKYPRNIVSAKVILKRAQELAAVAG